VIQPVRQGLGEEEDEVFLLQRARADIVVIDLFAGDGCDVLLGETHHFHGILLELLNRLQTVESAIFAMDFTCFTSFKVVSAVLQYSLGVAFYPQAQTFSSIVHV